MANITNLEKIWCEENNITIDDYKNKYSREQKEQIKKDMKHRAEQEKAAAKEAKEAEKIAVREAKETAKIAARNAKIESYGSWAAGFEFDDNGKITSNSNNYVYLFENHPKFKNKLTYDSYKTAYLFNETENFTDTLYRAIQLDVEKYIHEYKPNKTIESLKTVADKYTFNSATDLLDSLKWDGKPRLETIFIDLLKVEDTPLNRHITKTWIIGAIQRLYEPGCPNENVLILTGAQGGGKSLTLKWLSGEFGFDAAINISSNEQTYGMKLQKCWLCCFDELSGLTKKDAALYKNWFSLTHDSFRLPYGHEVEVNPRHNAYCATTNDAAFLKDYSDSNERRMWVLECHATKEDGYKNAVLRTDKLWRQVMAEAVHYYKKNPDFIPYLGAEWVDELSEVQKKHKDFNNDDLADMLCEILDRPYILNENGEITSVDDIIKQIKNGTEWRSIAVGEKYGYINHISHAAVKRIMREVLGTSQKHKYMRQALNGRWCVRLKYATINGKSGMWYVRGKWTNDKEEIIDKVIRKYDPCAKPEMFVSENDEGLSLLDITA